MVDKELLRDRYLAVKASLPPHVLLVAITKKRTVEEIHALYELGHRDFGENYPQELRDKYPHLPDDIRWHFTGTLQTNKVKYIAPVVALVHAVHDRKLLDELDKRITAEGRKIPVLFQVHIARESSKQGMTPQEVLDLVAGWDPVRWASLIPAGLMGMATFTDDLDQVRLEFRGLKELFEKIRLTQPGWSEHFKELSMGMSGDVQVAIEEGSTMVRIGTAIFGDR
jgi:PLP dependent protein